MDCDKDVVLMTFADEATANVAASRLRSEGIEAHIQKDDCGGAYPSLQASGGVHLFVRPEDLEDAKKLLNEAEVEDLEEIDNQQGLKGAKIKLGRKPSAFLADNDLPSQQLVELEPLIFMYVLMAPLLSALFADKIDNTFVACLLFVALVGGCFINLRNRLKKLTKSLKEQERRLAELEGERDEEFE
jgi:hypothetical protein